MKIPGETRFPLRIFKVNDSAMRGPHRKLTLLTTQARPLWLRERATLILLSLSYWVLILTPSWFPDDAKFLWLRERMILPRSIFGKGICVHRGSHVENQNNCLTPGFCSICQQCTSQVQQLDLHLLTAGSKWNIFPAGFHLHALIFQPARQLPWVQHCLTLQMQWCGRGGDKQTLLRGLQNLN